MRCFAPTTLLALALLAGCADGGSDDDVVETDDTTGDTDTTGGPGDTDPGLPTDVEGVTCPQSDVCVLTGTITDDLTLTPNVSWVLSGGVFIGDDVHTTTLTVRPGTKVYGETASGGFLVITRHSKIMADGTKDKPIVFTQDQPAGSRVRGGWGGVVLRGLAPINVCTDLAEGATCEADLEGGAGKYGGADPHDSSGVLRYVRVEFAGYAISPDNELNGITMGGVGDGTTVDHVEILNGNDDGIEFFGGTVDVKHVVIACTTDDGLDWDNGYRGRIQHGLVVQCDEAGNNGFEGDNHPTNFTVEPLSHPTIANVTLLGDPSLAAGNMGMQIRRGSSATLSNVLVTGFTGACLSLRDQESVDHLTADGGFDHVLFDCGTAFEDNDFDDDAVTLFAAGSGNDTAVADLKLNDSAWVDGDPDFSPKAGSPAASGGPAPAGDFFDAAPYVGGFAPGGPDWTDGWTSFARD
jgi:hypothetical protein